MNRPREPKCPNCGHVIKPFTQHAHESGLCRKELIIEGAAAMDGRTLELLVEAAAEAVENYKDISKQES